jgi:hypothetical protein
MAISNIFVALTKGVKVYLNRKNIVMQWLQREGFIVSPIDELAEDLENGNITLSPEDIMHNSEQFLKFIKSYAYNDFQKSLYNIIEVKNNVSDNCFPF